MAKSDRRNASTAAYQRALAQTRQAVRMQVEQHYRALPSLRDEHVPGFVDHTVRIVQAGQQRAIALTSAHMSNQVGLKTPTALNTAKIIENIRNGVKAEDVYARPIITARAGIEKLGFAQAFEKGLVRLLATAEMDVAMAARDASADFGALNTDQVIGFERVADPDCCDFCTEIDGAKVYNADPAPLHNNCGCTLEAITKDRLGELSAKRQDEIVREDLAREFGAGTGTYFRDTWETVVNERSNGITEVQQHGEMGPVITARGDSFTGLDDLPKSYFAEDSRSIEEIRASIAEKQAQLEAVRDAYLKSQLELTAAKTLAAGGAVGIHQATK